jgi:hypothetical protein
LYYKCIEETDEYCSVTWRIKLCIFGDWLVIFISNIMDSLSCTGSEDITVNYSTCDNKIVNTTLNVWLNTI